MNAPDWLDRDAYPFEAHYLALPEGRLHYVDEGSGEALLLMHGLPVWSFLYRHLIRALRTKYRLIAPDHLGFGLSDKPTGYSYRPQEQARTIAALINDLDLRDITVVAHDFGGPVGLAYALDQPQNVRRVIVLNTWLWPLQDDFQMRLAGGFLGSPVGRLLHMWFNFEVNAVMPSAYGDRSRLTRAIHDQYRGPLRDPAARRAVWIYTRELLRSREWYASLWARREALHPIPALLLWGLKDPVFGPSYLERWQRVFANVQTVTYPETGHYVQEEQGAALAPVIETFMASTP
ncbi:MAG: alpha/beta fold hydrolase [Chloroflexi bacterium]|nr:alpha/beta fold hydrolase [Chloroflexota bacterium]